MGAVASFWQLNLHRCFAASADLQRRLEHDAGFVALLQEPHTYGGLATISPSGTTVFQAPVCDNSRNRAAIVVSTWLGAWPLPDYTDSDVVTISLRLGGTTIWCASAYMPGDSHDPPPPIMVRKIIQHCEHNGVPLIIGCDANAHNVLWNSTNNNERGEALLDYLLSTNLEICNQGHEPTFVVQNRREVLDLTLASLNLAEEISYWRVDSTPSLSDHRCIRFNLAGHPQVTKVRRNIKRTDWDRYFQVSQNLLIECPVDDLSTTEGLDLAASSVSAALCSALDECCPPGNAGPRRKTSHWWSAELAAGRRRVRRAWNRASNTGLPCDWEQYRNLKREYKTQIRNAKRSSWRNFCSSFEKIPDSHRIGKLLKRDRRVQLDVLEKADGTYTSDPGETLTLMMSVHYPGSVMTSGASSEAPRLNHSDWRPDHFITEGRVAKAVGSFGSFKSPGGDMISPIMLQRAGSALVEILVGLYRASLSLSHIPLTWRNARAVFIPKPGKPSYHKAKSFRPITLTSFFLKVLERLVYWHLNECTGDLNSRMHHAQFAFKQGYSTEAALHNVVYRLEKAVFNKQLALALFLDIEGAFSNVSLSAIRRALNNAGIEDYLTNWITVMLNSQQVTATLGDHSVTVRLTRGTPQGGVLSPLLFNLVMSDLLRRLGEVGGIYAQAYADDVLLLSTGIDSRTLSERIQEGLAVVEGWAVSTSLSLCSNKTFATMFTWKRKWKYYPLRLLGGEVRLTDRVTYLGVTLDSKLSWLPHISDKAVKANRCLLLCRRAVGKTWGLSPAVMRWIYTTMIRPIISYAVTVWAPGLEARSGEQKLSVLQRKACLAVSSAYVGTPSVALEMLLGLPPLSSFLKGMAILGAYRLKRADLWKAGYIRDTLAHQSHVNWCSKTTTELPALAPLGDLCRPRLNLQVRFFTSTAILDSQEVKPTITCFTDGSKLQSGRTGAGVHFPAGNIEDLVLYLGRYSSVFQAEILAITLAAERLTSFVSRNPSVESVAIYSDSQAAIKAVTSLRTRSNLVCHCVNALNTLGGLTRVTLQWVKAHVGTVGNETADFLAKEAAMMPCEGPEPFVPVPYSACKRAVYQWIEEDCTKKWLNVSSCRQTKELFARPLPLRGWRRLIGLSRVKLRLTIQILTGHGNLGSHNFTIGKWDSSTCRRCDLGPESRSHIVEDCPAYGRLRDSLLEGYLTDLGRICTLHKFSCLSSFLLQSGRLEDFTA